MDEGRKADLEALRTWDGMKFTFHFHGPHASQRSTGEPGKDTDVRYSVGDPEGSPLLRFLMNGHL